MFTFTVYRIFYRSRWSFFMCANRSFKCPKSSGHISQRYADPSADLWTLRRCFAALDEYRNVMGHRPHLYDLSPVWMPTWFLRPRVFRNNFPQWMHSWRRSCVCVAKWSSRFSIRAKLLGHAGHWKLRSLVWLTRCRLSLCASMNAYGHKWHLWGLFNSVIILNLYYKRFLNYENKKWKTSTI